MLSLLLVLFTRDSAGRELFAVHNAGRSMLQDTAGTLKHHEPSRFYCTYITEGCASFAAARNWVCLLAASWHPVVTGVSQIVDEDLYERRDTEEFSTCGLISLQP